MDTLMPHPFPPVLGRCFRFIDWVSVVVPSRDRTEWRREWQAEAAHYWQHHDERGTLTRRVELQLARRCLGAAVDALSLRQDQVVSDSVLDLRYVIRSFTDCRGFTAMVLLTLALGVSANTAAFSLVYSSLFRPLPYTSADRIVRLHTIATATTGSVQGVSIQDLSDWQRASRALEHLSAYITFNGILLRDSDSVRPVEMTFVSPDIFALLGATPQLGGTYTADDDRIGGETNQIVLSHQLWRSAFLGDASVVGRMVELRGAHYRIAGVMPEGFRFPEHTDVWAPLHARYAVYPDGWWKSRDVRIHDAAARLKAGVTLEDAQAEIDRVAHALEREFPSTNDGLSVRLTMLRDAEVAPIRPYLRLLLIAIGIILAICSVTVALLLMGRSDARQREVAARAALGHAPVGTGRLVYVESLVLALAAGGVGVVLAYPALQGLIAFVPVQRPSWMPLAIEWRGLAFSLGIMALTGVLAGRQTCRKSTRRMLPAFVAAEVALSLLLLIGAALMVHDFMRLRNADTGIEAERVLTVQAGRFVVAASSNERMEGFIGPHRRAIMRLAGLPGVVAASGGSDFPYREQPEQLAKQELAVLGDDGLEQRQYKPAVFVSTWPGYFSTLRIPLLDGRDFTDADNLQASSVAIVSRHTADTLWPGRTAIGQPIRVGKEGPDNGWSQVVGVVGDANWDTAGTEQEFAVYFPYQQNAGPGFFYLLRTSTDPAAIESALPQALKEAAPEVAIVRVRTLPQLMTESFWQRRFWSVLFAALAAIALMLSWVGLHGAVRQRPRAPGSRFGRNVLPPAPVRPRVEEWV
jgi:predicted permease